MARYHIAAALGTVSLVLLITLSLISTFGLPRPTFFHLAQYYSTAASSANQIPINGPSSEKPLTKYGTQYLLGVGKADITG